MAVLNGENANCDFNCESSVNEELRVNDAISKFKELNVLIKPRPCFAWRCFLLCVLSVGLCDR